MVVKPLLAAMTQNLKFFNCLWLLWHGYVRGEGIFFFFELWAVGGFSPLSSHTNRTMLLYIKEWRAAGGVFLMTVMTLTSRAARNKQTDALYVPLQDEAAVILFSYCRQISRRSKLTVCYSVFQCFWTFLPSVWHRELRAHWFLLKTQILKKQIPFSAMCVQITWLLA